MSIHGYFAHRDFLDPLKKELKNIVQQYDRLILCEGEAQDSVWAQNIWYDCQWVEIESIKDAARKLKSIQKNWASYPITLFRRQELIVKELPKVKLDRLKFLEEIPKLPMGAFTLIEPNKMLVSSHTSNLWPHGIMEFEEDKENPPSRAYLKLWDIFTRTGKYPRPDCTVIELGASPGGWTWVLRNLGCKVYAFDRSELRSDLMNDSKVIFNKGDAFQAKPEDFQDVDWVFSDLICYPEKLLDFVNLWLADKKQRNFVCTIKFQGENPYGIMNEFRKISGSNVIHLYHNKHEVTWFLLREDS